MDCRHENLNFGSGGYYIFCLQCNAAWVARKPDSDEIDYTRSNNGLTTGDVRINPDDK